jgi:hypothetical protein
MKRLLNKLIVLVLMLSLIVQLFPSNASAAGSTSSELFFAATGGNVYYTVSAQTNTASIVGCDNSVTAVTIPATLPDGDGNPVPVTSIGTSAFYQEGYEGFSLVNQCQLAEISFGEDSQLMFIGEHTFKMTAIESVVLPASLTSIGYMGFARCANLTSVTMAELEEGESYSLTTIGNYAFGECPLLAEITLSAPLLSIGYSAFLQCRSLSSITLPSTLVSIGSGAFNDCSALASVTMAELPEGVTEHALSFIEAYAFGYCPNLVTISLPASLTTLGNEVFKNCTSLASVTFEESETPNLTSIGNGAFSGCAALTSITLPSSVTSVGNSAFYQSGLTSVTLSASVTSIGTGAFEKCLSLTEATILGQTSIVENTFSGCTALATVTIPNVTSIGITAFKGTGLTGVTLPDTLTSIGMNAFQNCTSLSSITWPDNESFTEVTGFNGCTSLPNSIISGLPSSVTTLGDYAFTGCSFTALVFPASITTIGEYAFYACNGLSGRTVDLPATITRVKARAFGYITTSAVSRLTLRFHNPQVSLRTDSGEFADILAHDYSDYQHTRYVDFFGAAEKSPGVASDVVSYVEAYFNAAYRVYTFTALDDLPVSYTVSGTLPAGASVSITRGSATVPATPGETPNSFTASVLTGADVTVTVSQAGYYDQVRTKAAADFTANWNLGAITLDPIPTTGRMYLNLTRSDTGAPFSSFNGLTFTLSKGAVILQEGTHYTISFPFLVISAEADVQSTDLLTLTVAADDSLKMSGGTATGTKLGGEFSLTLPAWGTLSVTTAAALPGKTMCLCSTATRLTQAGVTEAGSYSSGALKAGLYGGGLQRKRRLQLGYLSDRFESHGACKRYGLYVPGVSVTDQITTTGTLTVPF